jgi:hypothetical protein
MTGKVTSSSINAIQRIKKACNVDHGCGHSLVSTSVMVIAKPLFVLEGSIQGIAFPISHPAGLDGGWWHDNPLTWEPRY